MSMLEQLHIFPIGKQRKSDLIHNIADEFGCSWRRSENIIENGKHQPIVHFSETMRRRKPAINIKLGVGIPILQVWQELH